MNQYVREYNYYAGEDEIEPQPDYGYDHQLMEYERDVASKYCGVVSVNVTALQTKRLIQFAVRPRLIRRTKRRMVAHIAHC